MSLKKRAKIQHCTSPKSQLEKQIHEDLSLNSNSQAQKQNSLEVRILKKMQEKIHNVLKAYQKLQDQNKRKDDIIKELEKQNLLLKQRLVQKNSEKQLKTSIYETQFKRQPKEGHVIQRTFTPLDIRKQQKIIIPQISRPVQNLYNPSSSIVQQYNAKIPTNQLLKQSRSLENLNKTTGAYQSRYDGQRRDLAPKMHPFNEQQQKIFSKRDQNRAQHGGFDQDKSFMDVLGKLKEKIKKFDEQEVQNAHKLQQLKQQNPNEQSQFTLSRAKSSQNLVRKPFNFRDPTQKQEMNALKQIWNQRDEEIKRMDELFSKIDERINVIQKQ